MIDAVERLGGAPATAGVVYLAGTGPGDPGLVPLRTVRLVETADVIVYDRLIPEALVQRARIDAERIYVGKQGRGPSTSQATINDLIVARALDCKSVVRLKGGDPFVFGRGGEEAEIVVAAGLTYEVVPAPSSAIAAAAYAGIPITHRADANSFAVVTGHEDPSRPESRTNWTALAGIDTVIILMGGETMADSCARLIAAGKAPSTPAAAIRWGTTPRQETVVGTIATIAADCAAAELEPPIALVIGTVVRHRAALTWFERRPLFGKRILVTRAREQASQLVALLAARGADVIELPTIAIEATDQPERLNAALDAIDQPDWIVFTSANGVSHTLDRLWRRGGDSRRVRGRIAAVGPATAEALRGYGLRADWQPMTYTTAALGAGLPVRTGEHILLLRSDLADPRLNSALVERGAIVHDVVAYRTVPRRDVSEAVHDQLASGEIDAILLASSSTVHGLLDACGSDPSLYARSVIASIGPVTSEAIRGRGLAVDVEAAEATIPSLVQSLESHWAVREGVLA